jgi:hypothetical protein
MNYVKVIIKAEILLYSSLISIMSGINRLKEPERERPKSFTEALPEANSALADVIASSPERSPWVNWQAIQQALLSLLLWTVLGVAAGFLFGMLIRG